MLDRDRFLKNIRQIQSIISALLFISVSIFCWYFSGFDITQIQLSNWGDGVVAVIWNTSVCLFSISIFVNSFLYIKNHLRIKYKKLLYLLFGFISINLFIVGFYNLHHEIHNYSAYLYFFLYPLSIFIHSYLNRSNLTYKDWKEKVILSIVMTTVPLFMIFLFKGMAIAEISHTILVMIWNIKIALK